MTLSRTLANSLSLQSLPWLTIDISSWLTWAAYVAGFTLTLRLAPGMARELALGGPGRLVLLLAVATFFASVLFIQRQMRLSLKTASFGSPNRLVTDGLFRYSRNPMYVAFLVPLASFTYFSMLGATAAIALYVTAMNLLVIAREEKCLTEKFGADYRAYRARVPRWVLF